jgi:hypothetical protein
LTRLLALLLLLPSLAQAAPRKHWFTDPKWWIGETVNVAAVIADCDSTRRGLAQGLQESNPLLGHHPSARRLIGVCVGEIGALTSLHAAGWHVIHHEAYKDGSGYGQDNLFWRSLQYVDMAPADILIAHNAAKNYQLLK